MVKLCGYSNTIFVNEMIAICNMRKNIIKTIDDLIDIICIDNFIAIIKMVGANLLKIGRYFALNGAAIDVDYVDISSYILVIKYYFV